MSKEENFSFSVNNMRESIDRILSGQRRRYVLRFIITFNVIYIILLGIVVFNKGLKAVYIIHQYFSSSDSEFSPEFLLSGVGLSIVIIGHVCGLFDVLRKSFYLLLLSSFIGLNAGLVYIWLIVSNLYTIPVMVFIVCVALIHIELNLVFMSLVVAQNLHYRQTAQKNVIQWKVIIWDLAQFFHNF